MKDDFEERLKVVMDNMKHVLKSPSIKKSLMDFVKLFIEMNRNPETATGHLINYYRSIIPEEAFNKLIDEYYESRREALDQ